MKKNCIVEVYSRITGFFRPVGTWNPGKREEFHERKGYTKGRKASYWDCI